MTMLTYNAGDSIVLKSLGCQY